MRRELSLVGVSLLVYACALVLGSLVLCETVRASSSANGPPKAMLRMFVSSVARRHRIWFAEFVTWLWEPIDAEGRPMRDRHNPDPGLRGRPILGLALLEDFRRVVNEETMVRIPTKVITDSMPS